MPITKNTATLTRAQRKKPNMIHENTLSTSTPCLFSTRKNNPFLKSENPLGSDIHNDTLAISHDSRLLLVHAFHPLTYVRVSHGCLTLCHGYRKTYLSHNAVPAVHRQSITCSAYRGELNVGYPIRTRPESDTARRTGSVHSFRTQPPAVTGVPLPCVTATCAPARGTGQCAHGEKPALALIVRVGVPVSGAMLRVWRQTGRRPGRLRLCCHFCHAHLQCRAFGGGGNQEREGECLGLEIVNVQQVG